MKDEAVPGDTRLPAVSRSCAMRTMQRLLVAAALGLLLPACGDKAPAAPPAAAAAPVEVVAYTVQARKVPVSVELPGRTAAFASAEIRPQVGGILQKRLFTEGGEVRAGQVLYQIDPAQSSASVANSQAALASAQATLASARETATRYKELVAIEAVSRESADEADAAYKKAQADVAAAQATLQTARLELGYTRVTSPISGRIGRSSVTQGALLTASQTTALATVQQLDPIFVDATQSAAENLRVRREFKEGKLKIGGDGRPTARLTLEDGSAYPHNGQLLLAEAIVEETAGSVTLRAQFPNPERLLLPGMYVRMTLEGAVAEEALVVPQVALTRDAKGNAVAFVIGAGDKVEQRILTTQEAMGDQWIVNSGLKAGERVVVEGVQKVRAGAVVKVVDAAQSAAAASAPVTR
jgi:membrane fusion protein, multidrug efflux system